MNNGKITSNWFIELRDRICNSYEQIETDFALKHGLTAGKFIRSSWQRDGGGGGVMNIMHGNVFEKVGVNISTVFGTFSSEFSKQVPGALESPEFFATGISIVAHMCSPHVPAVHFNSRYIHTTKSWFGGGGDLTPIYPDSNETAVFHKAFKDACDLYSPDYYPKFKQACDEYFFLKHRNEPRGVGGIFFDYLNTDDFARDFGFVKDVGLAMFEVYPKIVRNKMHLPWSNEEREFQLYKRGRYVEFNLLYDRGTTFGLATGGNVEAIFMSLPPVAKWP